MTTGVQLTKAGIDLGMIVTDSAKALDVWKRDQQLDAMYNSLFRELLTYMMEDPRNISLCTHLLFGAKNLERIGDHAKNIAEFVIYVVKGADVRHTALTEIEKAVQ